MAKLNGPVLGHTWGVSMIAPNEAVLGALLAMAKLWGCADVGYDIIKEKAAKPDHEKNPKNVAAGRKGGLAKKGGKGKRRAPSAVVVKSFFAQHKGARFATKDLGRMFAKYGYHTATTLHNAIHVLIADGKIKKIGRGVYVRLAKVAVAKKEAA